MSRPDELEHSPYYPRRARWYSPGIHLWLAIRRAFSIKVDWLPTEVSAGRFLTGLILPGLGHYQFGSRLLGFISVAVYLVAAFIFLAFFGAPAGSTGFGLMVAIHVVSAVVLLKRTVYEDGTLALFVPFFAFAGMALFCLLWFVARKPGYEDTGIGSFLLALNVILLLGVGACLWGRSVAAGGEFFLARLAVVLLAFGVYAGCVYWPLLAVIESRWLIPLQVGGRVVIVNRLASPKAIQRGDYVAYHIESLRRHGFALEAGYGFDRVLAMAGDTVRFVPGGFAVNGVLATNRLHMPTNGYGQISEKCWFIWPALRINGAGHNTAAETDQLWWSVAMVSEKQLIGRPFQQWLWRRQLLP